MPKKFKYKKQEVSKHRVNHQIRFSPVMVIQEGENLGVMPTDEARKIAKRCGLDLVEVAPQARPPVCRIMDYGKFKYEQGIKEKKQKQQKTTQVKEVRFTPVIGQHDIDTKIRLIRKFIEEGDKVNLKLEFRKRENAHRELGFDVMQRILAELADVGEPQRPPVLEGRRIVCLIEPK